MKARTNIPKHARTYALVGRTPYQSGVMSLAQFNQRPRVPALAIDRLTVSGTVAVVVREVFLGGVDALRADSSSGNRSSRPSRATRAVKDVSVPA
jgi:hypothetical protein